MHLLTKYKSYEPRGVIPLFFFVFGGCFGTRSAELRGALAFNSG